MRAVAWCGLVSWLLLLAAMMSGSGVAWSWSAAVAGLGAAMWTVQRQGVN